MADEIDLLVAILLDESAGVEARDTAAMGLGTSDDDRALLALTKIGSDESQDNFYQETCGESLALIMIRTRCFNRQIILGLAEPAKRTALAYFQVDRPEWFRAVVEDEELAHY